MITVNCNLNIKTCCFGASRLYDAKRSYLRAHGDYYSSDNYSSCIRAK